MGRVAQPYLSIMAGYDNEENMNEVGFLIKYLVKKTSNNP